MNLAATHALVDVIASTRPTLATGLQSSLIHHDGAGQALASLRNTDDGAKIRRHGLEAAGIEPAPALLGPPTAAYYWAIAATVHLPEPASAEH